MFTIKEKEICDLVIKGMTNKEIANSLGISVHTVKAHKENIYVKLKARNNVQAAAKYYIYKQKSEKLIA